MDKKNEKRRCPYCKSPMDLRTEAISTEDAGPQMRHVTQRNWFMQCPSCYAKGPVYNDVHISTENAQKHAFNAAVAEKPTITIGLPTISRLFRGMDVLLDDATLIPDSQIKNESVKAMQDAVAKKVILTCGKCHKDIHGTVGDIHTECPQPGCNGKLHMLGADRYG